jgi:hypothetical protein
VRSGPLSFVFTSLIQIPLGLTLSVQSHTLPII